MEFPQDQLILFKGLDSSGNVVGRFGLFDLGDGATDDVTIAKSIKDGITSFVYFYDVTSKKSVTLTFEGEADESVDTPVIIDAKGPNPIEFENGYVAFEDLPEEKRHLPGEDSPKRSKLEELLGISLDEDEDEEDDEEDEDVDEEEEEEEQIYDESEGF